MILIVPTLSYIAFASQSYGMHWYVPFTGDKKALHLNFTVADFGNTLPEAVCFGLINSSICVSLDVQNLDMGGQNITNVSYITINDGLCNSTGSCFTLTELNQSGNSDVTNYTLINESIDTKINNYNTTLWSQLNVWINNLLGQVNTTIDSKISAFNATIDYDSFGNQSFNQSLTDSLYHKKNENINNSGFNISTEYVCFNPTCSIKTNGSDEWI